MQPTAIVTGGAQGIGKGISRHLLKSGYHVIVADLDAEAGEEIIAEYAPNGSIEFVPTNVSDEASVKNLVTQTEARLTSLTALVNNAGIANPGHMPIEKLPLAEWQHIIDTNLTGVFLMSKYTVPFLKQNRGAIVNIASTRALQSEAHTYAYSASKGGVMALTHSLAVSLGPEIRVNCISPGWILVDEWQKSGSRTMPKLNEQDLSQHPVGRVGQPQDIAEMTAFLISDAAGFITGQNFVIDGGMTKKMIYVE